MATSHETLRSVVSDDEREKIEREVELGEIATHDSLSYERGRELALQANDLHKLAKQREQHADDLMQASTVLFRDSVWQDKPGKGYTTDRLDNPEIGPRLERAQRERDEAKLAFKAVSDVAGSMLTYDEDLRERAETKEQ